MSVGRVGEDVSGRGGKVGGGGKRQANKQTVVGGAQLNAAVDSAVGRDPLASTDQILINGVKNAAGVALDLPGLEPGAWW